MASAQGSQAQLEQFGVAVGLTSARIVDYEDGEFSGPKTGFSLSVIAQTGERSGLSVEVGISQRARFSRQQHHGEEHFRTRVTRRSYLYAAALPRLGLPVGGATAVFQLRPSLSLLLDNEEGSISRDLIIGAAAEAGIEVPGLFPFPIRLSARVNQDITEASAFGETETYNRVFELRLGVIF